MDHLTTLEKLIEQTKKTPMMQKPAMVEATADQTLDVLKDLDQRLARLEQREVKNGKV